MNHSKMMEIISTTSSSSSTNSSLQQQQQETLEPLGNFDSSSVDSKLNSFEEKVIISVFLIVIILGFFGNILVICTVIINKHMRTSNNLFILNLAISDLTLCIFSIPFNVYKVLRHTWIFGEFLCKFAPFFQATNVFVSTMSITAIALDRYISIVYAMKIRQTGNIFSSFGSLLCLVFIWAFAFLLSSPLFLFNIYKPLLLNFDSSSNDITVFAQETTPISLFQTDTSSSSVDFSLPPSSTSSLAKMHVSQSMLDSQIDLGASAADLNAAADEFYFNLNVAHCIENSPFHQSRLIYSYASLLIQYTLPILIVGVAYGSIWWKLKKQRDKLKSHQHNALNANQARNQQQQQQQQPQREGEKESRTQQGQPSPGGATAAATTANNNAAAAANDDHSRKNTVKSRRLKMNILLAFIAIIFAASWLPLNIFNILSDYNVGMLKVGHSYYLINAVCILFAMSSAVSNPFLYGFLNENFKREYVTLFRNFFNRCRSCTSCLRSPSNLRRSGNANNNNANNNQSRSKKTTNNTTKTNNSELTNLNNMNNNKKKVNQDTKLAKLSNNNCTEAEKLISVNVNEKIIENRTVEDKFV